MCYNKNGKNAFVLPFPDDPKMQELFERCAAWQRKFEEEKLRCAGLWGYMVHYEKMLETIQLIVDDPCDDCESWERCPGECAALDRIRAVLRGRNG